MTIIQRITIMAELLFVFLTGTHMDMTHELNYYGCYRDNPSCHDLEGVLFRFQMKYKLTVAGCNSYCRNRPENYIIAGVENGNQCFCGHVFGKYGRIDEKFCDKPCTGDVHEKCGGYRALSIYSAETNLKTDPIRYDGYLGCYKDSEGRRDFMEGVIFCRTNTPEDCKRFCLDRAYRYAGVQYGEQCFCGQEYGKYGPALELECDKPCPGLSTSTCGGTFRNAIYETGKRFLLRISGLPLTVFDIRPNRVDFQLNLDFRDGYVGHRNT